MHLAALALRLQQLEKNIVKVVQLLGEYEEELNDEDDPLKKSKYCRRIEDLKKKQIEYENELIELQSQSSNEQAPQFQNIAKQLQGIDNEPPRRERTGYQTQKRLSCSSLCAT